MKNNDIQLIHLTLEGDDNAFAELVQKYQKQVHTLVWRKIGDFHIAEEITQDTFLRAYNKLATLKQSQSFASWLYVIATSRCNSWLHKKHRRTQLMQDMDAIQPDRTSYSEYRLEENERITAQTQQDVVKKLLAKLEESERIVITLHYFGEMSCSEIGTFLGVSENTVKSRLRRARERLKKEETIIREAIDNFQISPHLTDSIMREITHTKVSTPTSGKPLVPWTVVASTLAVVLLILGFGNSPYHIRFQQPYSLEANSETMVEIVDAHLVANLESKPNMRIQNDVSYLQSKIDNPEQQPNDTSAIAETQAEEVAEDYTKWELPHAAKARLGKGGINAMQFSPDGSQLAVGSNIGIWLYDAKTGKELTMFPGMCQSIAFSPDGKFLANGGGKYGGGGKFRGKELQLWEVATGRKVALIDSLPPASVLRFSEDGKTLLSLGSWGDLISQLDVETGKANVKNIKGRSWEMIKERSSPEPYALTFDKFAVGAKNGEIELWGTLTGEKLSDLIGHSEQIQIPGVQAGDWKAIDGKIQIEMKPPLIPDQDNHVLALVFSPDGALLASGSKDKTVRLWDTTSKDKPIILRKHSGWANVLAFSPDGIKLASGSTDKTVLLWDTATGELLASLIGHSNGIAALTFSPDGSRLASASTDGIVRFWNTEVGTSLRPRITGHTEWVRAVTFFRDSTKLVSVSFNGIINFWELRTSKKDDRQITMYQDFLSTLAFSPDGTKFVSIGAKGSVLFQAGLGISTSQSMTDQLIRLTDISTGRELANLKATSLSETFSGFYSVSNLTFSPDGKMIATDDFGKIRVWNTETGSIYDIPLSNGKHIDRNDALIFKLDGDVSSITALEFSPDSKKLVSGTLDGKVQMWDVETGVELASFTEDNPRRELIKALSFTSNGNLLAVGSNKRIRVMGRNKQIGLKEIPNGVETLVFATDSTVLVTGLRNGIIELWDIESGDKLTTLDGHSAPVETLVFSPDSKTVVSGGQDGTILLWDWEEVLKGIQEK